VVFPAEALAGHGLIAGTAVRWHTGYPPRAVDRHDVPLLCDRFGMDLPDNFG
jgi:lincosamide nucleotidyltransferase A/C/D/E